jgi:hypothetical protein
MRARAGGCVCLDFGIRRLLLRVEFRLVLCGDRGTNLGFDGRRERRYNAGEFLQRPPVREAAVRHVRDGLGDCETLLLVTLTAGDIRRLVLPAVVVEL